MGRLVKENEPPHSFLCLLVSKALMEFCNQRTDANKSDFGMGCQGTRQEIGKRWGRSWILAPKNAAVCPVFECESRLTLEIELGTVNTMRFN